MALPRRRPELPPDPTRDRLVHVRRGLFRLHKALIDSERAAYEAQHGARSSGQFLQALLGDPYFEWLQPFSGLIVRIDEALASRDAPLTDESARGFIEEVRTLVVPADEETAGRFEEVRRRDPGVLIADLELNGRLTDLDNLP
ncbi:MAG TPA: hypothetical protein VFE05_08845 [Longimicrobiaceae bacterium]|jgi:hypothetical protein|nr:hypothetical protein [Longimicrobiaceae bacterium]